MVLVSQSCPPTLCSLTECSPSGSSVGGFSRQEYCRGLPFPCPGDLPNPGIKPRFPVSPALAGGFFTTEHVGENYGSNAQNNLKDKNF